jgi:hypothetical protein
MQIVPVILAALLFASCATAGVEEPSFSLSAKIDDLEIRDYAPTVIAEVDATGDAVGARFSGFSPLADYIFAKERSGPEIAMTAPVTQSARETIAMTAPVTQQGAPSGWTIAFTMPSSYALDALPTPANSKVRLSNVPARRLAVIRFSGVASEAIMRQQAERLLTAVASAGLTATGAPIYAFYDPPWTLPFFRRNEVMVEIAR